MYKVIKLFKDKYNGQTYKVGDDFKSDDTARINDLIDRGIIKKTEREDGDWKDYLQKYPATEEYLSSYTKKELQAMLDDKCIEYNARAKKEELIKLLGGD
jgi:hypothetical protein